MYSHESELAAKCFRENREQFTTPEQSPEKFNLYSGLEHMALMIMDLHQRFQSLEHELHSLRQDLQNRGEI